MVQLDLISFLNFKVLTSGMIPLMLVQCENRENAGRPYILKVIWTGALIVLLQKARGDKSQGSACYYSWDDGESYRGRISTTVSGFQCQKWTAQFPHKHTRTPTNYPFAGLEGNYCRNPDLGSVRPWCYTMDHQRRWEVCEIPVCSDADRIEPADAILRPATPTIVDNGTSAITILANTASTGKISATVDPSECYEVANDGANYRGLVAVTENGYPCQNWTDQSPHQHSRTPENYPSAGLNNNYCRNPDNEEEPWCYTTNPKRRWEYCSVPQCPAHGVRCYVGSDSIADLVDCTSDAVLSERCLWASIQGDIIKTCGGGMDLHEYAWWRDSTLGCQDYNETDEYYKICLCDGDGCNESDPGPALSSTMATATNTTSGSTKVHACTFPTFLMALCVPHLLYQ